MQILEDLVQKAPKKWIDVILNYALPYGIGVLSGSGLSSMVATATPNVPRLGGFFGADDAAVIAAGSGAMLYGDKVVPIKSETIEIFGAGMISSWFFNKIVPMLLPQQSQVARSMFSVSNVTPMAGFAGGARGGRAMLGQARVSDGGAGAVYGGDIRDNNSAPTALFSGAVAGGTGEDLFYNRGSTRFAS